MYRVRKKNHDFLQKPKKIDQNKLKIHVFGRMKTTSDTCNSV